MLYFFAYFLDPELYDAEEGEETLPPLPDIIIDALKPLQEPLSPGNTFLDLNGKYSNYIIRFFNDDDISNIKRIAKFQLKLFNFIKILRGIVIDKYYIVETPDYFYETANKLDKILWSKCYKMRGVTSGLY